MRRSLPVLLCLLSVAVAPARAATPYAELQLGASAIRYAGLDFVSPAASVSAGLFLRPGIGVEAFADTALERGDKGGFETGLERAYGVALRLSSPPSDGLIGYVVLGYVDFTVAQRALEGDRLEIEEDFTGARLSIGLAQRLRIVPTLLVSAEYRNFYTAEAIQVDGLVLGLRLSVR